MGAYLSAPVTEKVSTDKTNKRLSYGASSMQGWRVSQEDAHNCVLDYDDNSSLFAVYDGHGGAEVAQYCALNLPDYIKTSKAYKSGSFGQALEEAFLGFDEKLTTEPVLEELKAIAGLADDDGDDDEGEDDDETALLHEEAFMPLADILAKYYNKDGQSTAAVPKKLVDQHKQNFQSPAIRAKADGTSKDDLKDLKVNLADQLTNGGVSRDNEGDAVTTSETTAEKISSCQALDCPADGRESSTNSGTSGQASSSGSSGAVESSGSSTSAAESSSGSSTSAAGSSSGTSTTAAVSSSGSSTSTAGSASASGSSSGADNDQEQAGSSGVKSIETGTDQAEEDDDDYDSEEEENQDYEDEDDDDDSDEEGGEGDGSAALAPFFSSEKEDPGMDSGCTAVVALIRNNELFVANAGDSRCVLCKDGKAVEMSFDHKPEDEVEKTRIEKAGGKITMDGRVNGGLNLSRAIGDHTYKQNKDISLREQMISSLPDVKSCVLDDKDEFIVIACDGIWNSMTSQEVVQFVLERVKNEDKKLSEICEELFAHCLASDTTGDGTGCDNMTCIVIRLKSLATGPRAKRPSADSQESNGLRDESVKKPKTDAD